MKPWYLSKTIWFNLLTFTPLMLDAVVTHVGLLRPFIPDGVYPVALAVLTIGNVWLRLITTEALKRRNETNG